MMARVFIFASVVLLLSLPVAASAQDGASPSGGTDPVLREASIRLSPDGDGVEVIERIALSNIGGLDRVDHIFTRFGEAGPEDLVVRAGGRELSVDRTEGDVLDKIAVPVPQGTNGDLAYEISYRYPEGGDAAKVPLVVPTIPPAGDANSVTVRLAVPEGRYLQSSFPLVRSGDTGVVETSMIGFPNYSSFVLDASPAGIITRSNAYTALGVVVILGCIAGMLLYDRRSAARPGAREVTDV
jgi:hypothetical protein